MFIMTLDNKYYFYWQPVIGFASILSSYIATYFAAYSFNDVARAGVLITYKSIVEMLFVIDILLPFLREYKTDDGRVVRKFKKIAGNYIWSIDFWVMLLPLLFIDEIALKILES